MAMDLAGVPAICLPSGFSADGLPYASNSLVDGSASRCCAASHTTPLAWTAANFAAEYPSEVTLIGEPASERDLSERQRLRAK